MMVSSAELKEHIQGVRGEVQLLNYEEALAYAKGRPYEHELDKMMNQEKLPFSKAQMYPDFILGKCLIDEGTVDHPKQIYAVYCLTPETLLLITPKKSWQTPNRRRIPDRNCFFSAFWNRRCRMIRNIYRKLKKNVMTWRRIFMRGTVNRIQLLPC